ncbi:MAG: DUF2085 domain-containing protein [Anaerolineales bacterium]
MSKSIVWKTTLVLVSLCLLGIWLVKTPEGLLGKADAVGYAICHRLPSHSFQIHDRPSSLCARCTGQYLGVVVGLTYLGVVARRRSGLPHWTVLILLTGLFFAYLVDALNSLIHYYPELVEYTLYQPRNEYRFLSGMGMGLTISVLVHILFQRTVWKRFLPQPVLRGFRPWVGFFLSGGLVAAAVLSGEPWILTPLTLVSVLGVVGLLTLLYALIWIIFFGLENRSDQLREIIWPLVGGFATALLQIGGMDLLRFGLTGTWSGFTFG